MPTAEELAREIEASNQALLAQHAELKAAVTAHHTAIEELKARGAAIPEPPPEIANRIAGLDTALADSTKRIGEMFAELAGEREKQTALAARLDAWERVAGRPGNTFSSGGEELKTPGQMFIEQLQAKDEAEFRLNLGQVGGRSMTNYVNVEAKLSLAPGYVGFQRPTDIRAALGGDATPNFFIRPYQIPGWVPQARRRLTIRQLMPTVPITGARKIDYLRKRGFTTSAKASVTSITRAGSVATATQTAHGYDSFNIVEITGADQAEYNGLFVVTKLTADTFTFNVSGSPASPATGTIKSRNMNGYGAAAFVAENSQKPEAAYVFSEATANVQILAHYTKVGRQVLDDLPGLRQEVDFDLMYGLSFKEELALLYGAGTGSNIEGITNVEGVQAYAWSQGKPGDIKWDALRRARTRVELLNYTPDAVVIHPLDWEDIETVKGATGYYIYLPSGPGALSGLSPEGENMVRLQVVVTPAVQAGTFVLGPWAATSAIYDRELANIRFTDSDADDFTNNKITVLAEERLAAVWKVPESFVLGSFDEAPTQ